MFLKFIIYKIEGDSMSPSIDKNSFVLIKSFKKKKLINFSSLIIKFMEG